MPHPSPFPDEELPQTFISQLKQFTAPSGDLLSPMYVAGDTFPPRGTRWEVEVDHLGLLD